MTLPAARELGLTSETTYVLADIETCKADITGPLGVRLYDSLEVSQVIDISCIQSLVGRFPIAKMHGRPVWGIVDRSGVNGEAILADNEWNDGAGVIDDENSQ